MPLHAWFSLHAGKLFLESLSFWATVVILSGMPVFWYFSRRGSLSR
jgi:hypothetical protein